MTVWERMCMQGCRDYMDDHVGKRVETAHMYGKKRKHAAHLCQDHDVACDAVRCCKRVAVHVGPVHQVVQLLVHLLLLFTKPGLGTWT